MPDLKAIGAAASKARIKKTGRPRNVRKQQIVETALAFFVRFSAGRGQAGMPTITSLRLPSDLLSWRPDARPERGSRHQPADRGSLEGPPLNRGGACQIPARNPGLNSRGFVFHIASPAGHSDGEPIGADHEHHRRPPANPLSIAACVAALSWKRQGAYQGASEEDRGSIERFGFANPVLISDEGEIIAGHGRVEAAKQLGLEQIPTVRLSSLTPGDRIAYNLADNRLGELARYDRDLLAVQLDELTSLSLTRSRSPAFRSVISISDWMNPLRSVGDMTLRRTRSLCRARGSYPVGKTSGSWDPIGYCVETQPPPPTSPVCWMVSKPTWC